jgi:hypothetical protein
MTVPARVPEPIDSQASAPQLEEVPAVRRGWSTLVRESMKSALLVLIAKGAATVFLANFAGAVVEVRLWRSFLPFLAVIADTTTFSGIITHSTIAVSVVAAIYQLRPFLKPMGRQIAMGRALAVMLAAETYLLEIVRHVFFHEVLRSDRSWYAIFPLLAGGAIAAFAIINAKSDDPPEIIEERRSSLRPFSDPASES